jgi:hypothetical protein
MYFGMLSCRECHNFDQPDEKVLLVCRRTECPIWEKDDKHSRAYAVLGEAQGQSMARLLQQDVTKREAGCLACHAAVVGDAPRYQDFSLEEGVTCVVCHGPYKEWIRLHGLPTDREEWREHSRRVKQDSYGMTDLWSPDKRAELCASCHIGNADQGKFVTHAMYAAGHPPLPSLEVVTFGQQMPPHWEALKKKKAQALDLLKIKGDVAAFEETRLAVIGSVASLRESLNLLAAQASQAAAPPDGHERGLDLANFDCYACHHDLKTPSWRQRGYPGKPGRPRMRSWTTPLVKVSLEEFGSAGAAAKQLGSDLRKLADEFDDRPFGNCQRIGPAARGIADGLGRTIDALKAVPYDRAAAGRLLRRLGAAADAETPDYDSARQIAWAFRIIYAEWKPGGEKDSNFVKVWDDLDADLQFRLPRRGDNKAPPSGEPLDRLSRYDPDRFKQNVRRLSALVGPP